MATKPKMPDHKNETIIEHNNGGGHISDATETANETLIVAEIDKVPKVILFRTTASTTTRTTTMPIPTTKPTSIKPAIPVVTDAPTTQRPTTHKKAEAPVDLSAANPTRVVVVPPISRPSGTPGTAPVARQSASQQMQDTIRGLAAQNGKLKISVGVLAALLVLVAFSLVVHQLFRRRRRKAERQRRAETVEEPIIKRPKINFNRDSLDVEAASKRITIGVSSGHNAPNKSDKFGTFGKEHRYTPIRESDHQYQTVDETQLTNLGDDTAGKYDFEEDDYTHPYSPPGEDEFDNDDSGRASQVMEMRDSGYDRFSHPQNKDDVDDVHEHRYSDQPYKDNRASEVGDNRFSHQSYNNDRTSGVEDNRYSHQSYKGDNMDEGGKEDNLPPFPVMRSVPR